VSLADRRVEYESAGLDVGDVADDPVAQWRRWYDEAVASECVEPNAAIVATVDADGRPDARYVLVRDADERGFAFYTNVDSAKGRQLAAHPQAALTFGWLELHRQVRVRGRVEPVTAAEAEAYFTSRPRASRIGAWASPQSEVLPDRVALEARVAEADARFPGDDVPLPPFWGGFRVVHEELEFWQGRRSRLHDRLRYRPGPGGWIVERLAP